LKHLLTVIVLAFPLVAFSQSGQKSFEFLHAANNARLAALGGVNTSLANRDVNFFYSNPALVSDSLAGFASATYQFYVADIGQATATYAHRFKTIGTLVFGVQHLNYGTIKSYDATGAEIGTYRSGETAIVVGKSHQINNFSFGANLKFAFSNIAAYRATAVLADLGGTFNHPTQDLRVGLVLKNMGLTLSEYSETSATELPFDVQAGITFKPEHMPIRFSFTAYNLARKDVVYKDVNTTDEPGTFDKILRRVNFGAEILLHRNVNVLVGYNHLTHQELKLETGGGGAGVSLGFSARIKSFEFIFSRSGYVAGKAGYGFTVSSNINSMLKKGSL
jgi:hypothetical protein